MSGPINLTEVDFEEIKDNLIAYLKSTKQFTDYDFAGSNLQVILNLISYQAQLNAYSTNMIANESFLTTSSIRKNVVANARSLGYTPVSARSSFSLVTFQFQLQQSNYPSGFPLFVEVRPGMSFTTSDGSRSFSFNILDTQVAAVNNLGIVKFENVSVYEGTYVNSRFVKDESEFNQKFVIENKNVDVSTLRVEVQEDPSVELLQFYRRADNLVELTEESRIYWIEEVDKTYYELTFGDGYFGKKLQNDAKIFCSYLISSGDLANGVQNTVNFRFVGNAFDSEGIRVTALPSVISVSPSEGGDTIESIGSIKFRAPREYSAQNRCVVSEDYEALVRRVFPSVEDMYVYGGETLDIPEYGRVYIVIKPKTGDSLSNTAKNYIKRSLDPYRVGSLDIIFKDPDILYVELISQVYYDEKQTLKDSAAITATVRNSLMKYVKSSAVPKFGGAVKYSNIVGIIDDSDPSITRNSTELVMRKDFSVVLNQPATYEICFNQVIPVNKEKSSIYSTGFRLELEGSDDPRTFYFENDPNTIRSKTESDPSLISEIYCFYFNDLNEKIKVNLYNNTFNEVVALDVSDGDQEILPFGVLDYERGEVMIGYEFKNGVIFSNSDKVGNIVQIRTLGNKEEVFAKESVFLSLDVESSDINATIDTKTIK